MGGRVSPPLRKFAPTSRCGGSHARGRDRRRGAPGGPAARAVGHAPQRRAGLARPDAARLPADRLRRARPRRLLPRAPLRLPDLVATSTRCARRPRDRAGGPGRSSMGAATAMAFALSIPSGVPALVQITPAYTGYARTGDVDEGDWERRDGLDGGVDEFVEVAQPQRAPELARGRPRGDPAAHGAPRAPLAVAQALREIPRSIAWKGLEPLEARGAGPDRGLPGRRRHLHPLGSPRSTRGSCRTPSWSSRRRASRRWRGRGAPVGPDRRLPRAAVWLHPPQRPVVEHAAEPATIVAPSSTATA